MSELKLDLSANAYGFINEAIRNADRAVDHNEQWKFAIVNAAQGIELLLKERLRREHQLLVFTNVDKVNRHTVSMEQAIERLKRCEIELEDEDIKRLYRARNLRNDVVHYEVSATEQQMRAAFVDLLEFAHVFHQKELGDELHTHLQSDLWGLEAEFMEEFRREFITYQGYDIIKTFPSEIVAAQQLQAWYIRGKSYSKIPWTKEKRGWISGDYVPSNCHDCGVLPGQLHVSGCDMEQCPRCLGQLLSCPCSDLPETATVVMAAWRRGPRWIRIAT